MSTYKLKPSSAQVNEGDTLTTTVETIDVITGTTLYYRVVGKGINAKDFSSGALKGSLTVGADGKATLTHSLKADKATEGSESLTIEVFSDKKMKNRVGTSDAVTVSDTSMKAVKGVATSSVNSGTTKSRSIAVKDPLIGKLVKSDEVYNGFFSSAVDPNTSYRNGMYEIEANGNTIIITQRLDGWIRNSDSRPSRFDVRRSILSGSFSSDKEGNLSGNVTRLSGFNVQSETENPFFMETAQSYSYGKGIKIFGLNGQPGSIGVPLYFYSNLESRRFDYNGNVIGNSFDEEGKYPATPLYSSREQLIGKEDAIFFQEGWWQNPFTSNLI